MIDRRFYCLVFVIIFCFYYSEGLKFEQHILGVSIPFYKLLLSLGDCKKTVLFEEQKAWGKVRLNRIMDIYYKSGNPEYLVSKVEITIVINDTDCIIYSEKGVGSAEFAATMFVPIRVSMIFYHLTIFSCSIPTSFSKGNQMADISDESNEAPKSGQLYVPFYIRPDAGPHHIIFDNNDDSDTEKEESQR